MQKPIPKFISNSNNNSTTNLHQKGSLPSKFLENDLKLNLSRVEYDIKGSPNKIPTNNKLNRSRVENESKSNIFKVPTPEKKDSPFFQTKNKEFLKKDREENKSISPKKDFSKTSTMKITIKKVEDTNNTKNIFNKSTFRETLSNSPVKQFKPIKSPREIQDIDIDKESLMQLNRATNQFFSKKVKETIQKSMIFNKPGTSERKSNASLDETTYSFKSLDMKDKSMIKDGKHII